MTKAEQKADELIDYYRAIVYNESLSHQRNTEIAIECAIKCVDEIIDATPLEPHDGSYYETISDRTDDVLKFWQSVKQHLLNKA